MARAEIHAELRAMRPWVLTMSLVALVLLSLWSVLLIAGWQSGAFLSTSPYSAPDLYLLLLAIQLTAVVLLAPLPFVTLFRFAGSLATLDESRPATLRDSLELNRAFWRQAEWLMWAVSWLMAFGIIGLVLV